MSKDRACKIARNISAVILACAICFNSFAIQKAKAVFTEAAAASYLASITSVYIDAAGVASSVASMSGAAVTDVVAADVVAAYAAAEGTSAAALAGTVGAGVTVGSGGTIIVAAAAAVILAGIAAFIVSQYNLYTAVDDVAAFSQTGYTLSNGTVVYPYTSLTSISSAHASVTNIYPYSSIDIMYEYLQIADSSSQLWQNILNNVTPSNTVIPLKSLQINNRSGYPIYLCYKRNDYSSGRPSIILSLRYFNGSVYNNIIEFARFTYYSGNIYYGYNSSTIGNPNNLFSTILSNYSYNHNIVFYYVSTGSNYGVYLMPPTFGSFTVAQPIPSISSYNFVFPSVPTDISGSSALDFFVDVVGSSVSSSLKYSPVSPDIDFPTGDIVIDPGVTVSDNPTINDILSESMTALADNSLDAQFVTSPSPGDQDWNEPPVVGPSYPDGNPPDQPTSNASPSDLIGLLSGATFVEAWKYVLQLLSYGAEGMDAIASVFNSLPYSIKLPYYASIVVLLVFGILVRFLM